MTQESNEPVVVEKSRYRDKVIAAVAVVLVLSLVWFLYPSIKSSLQRMVNGGDKAIPFENLSGDIYLTLALSGTKLADLYEYNLGTGNLKKTFSDEADNRLRLTAKLSPDAQQLAFVDTSIDPNSNFYYPSSEWFQLRVIDKATGENTQITNTEDPSKRLGDWSPDGTKILYMKSDGLYLYDVSNDTKQLVLPTTESFDATTNIKMDVSDDGSWLALSLPAHRNIYLYKITSWERGIIEDKTKIEASGSSIFWPVFSPDSRYLVFQEADIFPGADAAANTRLSVYDLKAKSYRELMKLDGFNFDVAFISDWK